MATHTNAEFAARWVVAQAFGWTMKHTGDRIVVVPWQAFGYRPVSQPMRWNNLTVHVPRPFWIDACLQRHDEEMLYWMREPPETK